MKQSINKVTGLQVGFTTEWAVFDNGVWRVLTTEEKALVDIEEQARLLAEAEELKPKVITMRQARLALLQAGLLATVDAAIANGTDEAMKVEWDYATEVRRDWASLITMSEALGMTSAQLDELFALGVTL